MRSSIMSSAPLSALASLKAALEVAESNMSQKVQAFKAAPGNALLEAEYNVAKAKVAVARCELDIELIRPEGKAERLAEAKAKVEEIRKKDDSDSKKPRELKRAEDLVEKIEDEDERELLEKGEAKLDKAKAELKEAEAKLDKAKAELDKAEAKLDKAKAELKEAKAELDKAKATVPMFLDGKRGVQGNLE